MMLSDPFWLLFLSCALYLFRLLTNEIQDLVLLHMFAVYFNKVTFLNAISVTLHFPMLNILSRMKGRVGNKNKLFLVMFCFHNVF